MTFREKLNRELQRRGWSEGQLGRMLGDVPRQTVNSWTKRGSLPNLQTGIALARLLGVTPEYLADDSIAEPPVADSIRQAIDSEVARLGPREALRRLLAEDLAMPDAVQGHIVPPPSQAQGKRRRPAG